MSDAMVADGQIRVSTIKTRHRDALRDLQQNENDRLNKIKNDPSRRVSRGNPEKDTDDDLGANCIQELLPVTQVWAGALEASRLSVGNRLALSRRDLLQHYDAVGAGYVASKICHLEKLIILIASTREKVDTTVKAGHKRISQIVSAAPPPGTLMVPAVGDKSEDLSLGFDNPELFRSGSTQAYQKNQLDANSIAVLTELMYTNNGKPLALSCGVYSDQDTEHPIDVTAVAMIANGILYVALTIDPLEGHEMDKNAYGVKKVKVFTSEQSVNVLERTVEIVPPRGTRFPSPPPASKENKEEDLVSNLDLKFRGAGEEKVIGNRHNIYFSEVGSDDDDSDGDMGDDDDDGESDSSGDSEGDQDLALYLLETGNLARSPVPALRRRSLDSLTGSLLGLKTPTRSQGTNTSLYYTGYQSKCMLGSASQSDMKDMDMSLPDCSCRRIRCFDLEEVKSVTCSSTSFVLQRGCDTVAFTGSLQSAISESILDARFFVVGDTSFQWTRSAAASGWMSKQPTTLSSANSSSKGDAGAVAGFVKGDKANRRFLSLRDNTLRYDNVQTLSSRSHCEACESDSVLHTRSPSSSPRPSLSPVPSPIPSGMLKVIGDKTSPKVSHRKGDLSTPSSLASPLPSSLKTSAVTAATIRTSPAASAFAVPPATPVNGTRRTLASHIYSMFSKKSIKSPAKPRVNRLWAFGGRRKDRYNRDASGVIDITESSTVTTRCSNPRPGVCPFITLETAKETLRVCYEHMDPPPALPFGHQGYDELHSSVTRRRSVSSGSSSSSSKNIGVDSKRDTVHAHWINEMRRSIAQQTKKPLLLTRNRMESEWSHESTGFLCVAVDAVVEPLQYTSPSPPMSRTGSEARDECSIDGAEGGSGIKCTHAALYCMRTIKHSFTQKVLSPPIGRENVPCDTPSKSAMSKERVSSALLGDYSAKVEQTLAAGNRANRVGKATQSEEDATGRTLYASAGAGACADPKNNSTREDADAVVVSDDDADANMGMVNNAYYVCVGFVTSAGEAQSTQLIKVLNEKFNSNLGTDLSCMLQCGDILVFGGAHGFVGIGVGVPHSGSSNEDHESSVAIVCVFPSSTGSPASSSTRANTRAGTSSGVEERDRVRENAIEWENKIEREGENVNGSPESCDSSSSSFPVLPSTTYESEEYYGDVIPVPSTPRPLLAYDRVKKNKKGQRKEIGIVVQSEMPEDKETDKGKEKETERGRGIDVDIETEIMTETERETEMKEEEQEAPVAASMAVLRARGHGYNSNITCLATHSLELENESRLYCAGDDCGGVSLWRIVPCTANTPLVHAESHSKGQQKHCDRDRDRDRERLRNRVRERERSMSLEESKELGFIDEDDEDDEDEDLDNDSDNDDDSDNDTCSDDQENEESASSITVAPELQCFLNVNCLPRQPYASTHNSYTGTEKINRGKNDDGEGGEKAVEKEERVVTLQFLPNSELLLVGTNKRLLLIVVGAAATPGAATVQASDLDPGLNSGICGDVWNVSIDLLRDSSNTFSPQAREQSLSHWLSQSPTPYKRQYMNMNMNTDASKDSDMTFVSWIELDQVPPYCEGIFSMSVGPEGGQGGSEHGSGSGSGSEQGRGQGQGQDEEMSIFLWKVILQLEVPILDRDVLVPVPASADTVTPKIPALNLNLKEEKETPFMNDDSKNNRTTARSNFDVDVDDLSDCRVYRLKWTAEMFRTAFKNSKAIPQHALEDHLSKIY